MALHGDIALGSGVDSLAIATWLRGQDYRSVWALADQSSDHVGSGLKGAPLVMLLPLMSFSPCLPLVGRVVVLPIAAGGIVPLFVF